MAHLRKYNPKKDYRQGQEDRRKDYGEKISSKKR